MLLGLATRFRRVPVDSQSMIALATAWLGEGEVRSLPEPSIAPGVNPRALVLPRDTLRSMSYIPLGVA